ncbi:cuticle protein 19.8-like isoform X1 [Calliphora vicina]|uniref:cuticle protein 19.8-like isoform X1 n=1 Tax=Calliphora vicina TaxID=7373 RepID=UPI00325BA7DA
MFKYAVVILAVIACAAAKPGLIGAPLAYRAAPFVAAPAPVITATSSQVVARTYNGIAHAPIVAPVAPVARVVAPVAPVARVVAPAHVAHVAAPFAAAYSAPVVARYATAAYAHPFAARYTAPLAYSAPLAYPHAAYATSYAW